MISMILYVKYILITKGQTNSEWIYEVIVSSKIPTKNYRDFCPGSLLEGSAPKQCLWKGNAYILWTLAKSF